MHLLFALILRKCFCCSAVHRVYCHFPLKNRILGIWFFFFSPFNLQGAESGLVQHWEIRQGCQHGGNSTAWSSRAMKEALKECLRRWRALLQSNGLEDSRSNNSNDNTSNNMNPELAVSVKRSVSTNEHDWGHWFTQSFSHHTSYHDIYWQSLVVKLVCLKNFGCSFDRANRLKPWEQAEIVGFMYPCRASFSPRFTKRQRRTGGHPVFL